MCDAALDVSRAPETRVSGPSSARICDSEPRYWPNACAPVGVRLRIDVSFDDVSGANPW